MCRSSELVMYMGVFLLEQCVMMYFSNYKTYLCCSEAFFARLCVSRKTSFQNLTMSAYFRKGLQLSLLSFEILWDFLRKMSLIPCHIVFMKISFAEQDRTLDFIFHTTFHVFCGFLIWM